MPQQSTSTVDATLVGTGSRAWRDALAGMPHDAYALPEYAELAARRHSRGEPVAFIARDGASTLLLPLILRELPPALTPPKGLRDAVSPRGYAAAMSNVADAGVGAGAHHEDFVRLAAEAFPRVLRGAGVATAFVRLHPLATPPLDVLRRTGDVVVHGSSVSIDLAGSLDELRLATRQNHRRHIARALRAGYAARVDDRWERYDDFLVAYGESMARLESDPFWRLPRSYFDDIRRTLGDRAHLCVVERGDELASACILSEVGGTVDYYLAGTRTAHLSASPSKLMLDFARNWAKLRGNHTFHLGGSLGPDDALIHFKRGFSPLEHPVATWRVVSDPDATSALSAAWRRLHGTGTADSSFPEYRRQP